MYRPGTLLLLLLSLALAPSRARANSAAQEARGHFRAGTQAFDLGHYDEAAREFEAAYRSKEDPSLLFNLAQAYRQGGRNVDAVRVYKSFLHHVPDAPNREEVERRIATLERAIDEQRRAKDGPPEGTLAPAKTQNEEPSSAVPTPPPNSAVLSTSSPWYKDAVAMTLAGVGVAAIGVGGGLTIDGALVQRDADASSDLQKRADLHHHASQLEIAGAISAGAGVLVGLGAILRLSLRPKVPATYVLQFDAGPGIVSANLHGSF